MHAISPRSQTSMRKVRKTHGYPSVECLPRRTLASECWKRRDQLKEMLNRRIETNPNTRSYHIIPVPSETSVAWFII